MWIYLWHNFCLPNYSWNSKRKFWRFLKGICEIKVNLAPINIYKQETLQKDQKQKQVENVFEFGLSQRRGRRWTRPWTRQRTSVSALYAQGRQTGKSHQSTQVFTGCCHQGKLAKIWLFLNFLSFFVTFQNPQNSCWKNSWNRVCLHRNSLCPLCFDEIF